MTSAVFTVSIPIKFIAMELEEINMFSEMRKWAKEKLTPLVGYRVHITMPDKNLHKREITSTVVNIDPSGCIYLLSGKVVAPESIDTITKLSSNNGNAM